MTSLKLAYILLLPIFAYGQSNNCSGKKITDYTCVPNDYIFTQPPSQPVWLTGNLDIFDVRKVDMVTQSVVVHMYIMIEWDDPRIELNFLPNQTHDWLEELEFNKLWSPLNTISNLVDIKVLSTPRKEVRRWVSRANRVGYFFLSEVTVSCAMQFQNFPFDVQNCAFELVTFEQIKFENVNIMFNQTTQKLQQYHITTSLFETVQHTNVDYNSSYHGIKFTFYRYHQPFIMKYILPCCSMVLVSSVSFIIPPDAIPGRIALLVTIFLVLTNIFTMQQLETPISRHLTALANYILVCLAFVFAAIIEFGYLLWYKRHTASKPNGNTVRPCGWMGKKGATVPNPTTFVNQVDKIAFVYFYICFICYNIAYFSYYHKV